MEHDAGRLADHLRDTGRASGAIETAFRTVPRHLFLAGVAPADAYRDMSIVTRSDTEGLPASAATQPSMMAIMLDQLDLAPGQRVLEIGTGTGYNAALIAHLVQDPGSVVTVEVDRDLADLARRALTAAGYGGVRAVCGDGALGEPEHAPYDRIIVTAGAWDLAPQWLEQLSPGGRIVLPLSIRGIQVSVALEQLADHWASRSACRCGFIRMAGEFAGPEQFLPLGRRPGLHAQAVDGPVPDARLLYQALTGPVAEVPIGVRIAGLAELADLDLWLSLAEPRLARVIMLGRHEARANHKQQRIARLLPLGGFARSLGRHGEFGVAALAPAGHERRHAAVVAGYGPGGAQLARNLARQAAAWDRSGRPGTRNLDLRAYPSARPADAIAPGLVVIDRPHTRLAVGWQPPAAAA
jgi:protein-L-isoaspartate(D-aspartate) O-methyltransferase